MSTTLAPGPPGNPGGPAGPVGPLEQTVKIMIDEKNTGSAVQNNLAQNNRTFIHSHITYGRSSSTSSAIVTTSSLQRTDKHDWFTCSTVD